jgi:hypothetical protein
LLARNAAIEKRAMLLGRGGEEKSGNKGRNYSLGYKELQRSTYTKWNAYRVCARTLPVALLQLLLRRELAQAR